MSIHAQVFIACPPRVHVCIGWGGGGLGGGGGQNIVVHVTAIMCLATIAGCTTAILDKNQCCQRKILTKTSTLCTCQRFQAILQTSHTLAGTSHTMCCLKGYRNERAPCLTHLITLKSQDIPKCTNQIHSRNFTIITNGSFKRILCGRMECVSYRSYSSTFHGLRVSSKVEDLLPITWVLSRGVVRWLHATLSI